MESADTLSEISFLLERTGKIQGILRKELEKRLDFGKIGEALEQSLNVGFLLLFDKFSEGLVIELLKTIGVDDLAHELNFTVGIWGVGSTLKMVKEKSFTIAKNLVEKLDVNKIREKIRNETNLVGITICLREILAIDPKKWKKLVGRLDLHSLAKKMDDNNVTEIQRLLAVLSVNETVGRRLIHFLNIEKLGMKVDEGTNVLYIVHLLESLIELNEDVGRKLVQRIDLGKLVRKIQEEPPPFKKSTLQMLPIEEEKMKELSSN